MASLEDRYSIGGILNPKKRKYLYKKTRKRRIKSKVVYGQNQENAKINFRKNNKGYVPVKAEYAGTKHGTRVYLIQYRKRRKR